MMMYLEVLETILEKFCEHTTPSCIHSEPPFDDLPQAATQAISFCVQPMVHGGSLAYM